MAFNGSVFGGRWMEAAVQGAGLRAGAAGLALAALAGCNAGPDYVAPKVEAPAAWSEPAEAGLKVEPADLRRWWTSFHDSKLDSLVARAIDANLDLKIAAARVRQSRAIRGIAEADELPTVNADGSYSRNQLSENLKPNRFLTDTRPYDAYSVGFDASWELDFFGRIRRNVEASDADVAASVESERDVLVTLLADVARNYTDMRSAQQRLAIAQSNVKSQADTLELANSRFKSGLTSELDVAQAKANLESTRSTIPTFQIAAEVAKHRIEVLLGRTPGSLATELDPIGAVPATPAEVPVGLPSDLLRRRPDVRSAERSIAAATARIGVAAADLFPRVTLTGATSLEASKVGNLFDGNSWAYTLGPAIRWNIFDHGRIKSNIALQEALTDEARARYDRVVLTAFEDVENSLVTYGREHTRRETLRQAVAAADRVVQIASERYTRGLTDFENVLDAQRTLFGLQDQLAQSDQFITEDLIALYKALGGGWEDVSLNDHQRTNGELPVSDPPNGKIVDNPMPKDAPPAGEKPAGEVPPSGGTP